MGTFDLEKQSPSNPLKTTQKKKATAKQRFGIHRQHHSITAPSFSQVSTHILFMRCLKKNIYIYFNLLL